MVTMDFAWCNGVINAIIVRWTSRLVKVDQISRLKGKNSQCLEICIFIRKLQKIFNIFVTICKYRNLHKSFNKL